LEAGLDRNIKHRLKSGKQQMKKIYAAIICILIFSPMVFARRGEPLANDRKPGLYAKSIEQVLRLRENEVDLATAALIVSEYWSDMVYGRRYLETLDDMALEIRERLRRRRLQADYRAIPVINEYLFSELRFKSIAEASDPHDLFLHTVLDKKAGYCLSLSILYLSLGERLGIPLYGVVVPGHFFVRYDDGQTRFNIETTSKGGVASDDHYIKKFNVPRGSGIYMKSLNKIQTLGCFFNNLGNSYNEVGNIDSALLALERAVETNPTLSESRANLGNIYLTKGQVTDAIN
jgi:regulator of sirC expression with transglutaminase-like and TPR domain